MEQELLDHKQELQEGQDGSKAMASAISLSGVKMLQKKPSSSKAEALYVAGHARHSSYVGKNNRPRRKCPRNTGKSCGTHRQRIRRNSRVACNWQRQKNPAMLERKTGKAGKATAP